MQAVLATATPAGLTTNYTGGFVLYNPVGSTVNVAIERVGLAFVLAPAAPAAFGLATGASVVALAGTLTLLPSKSKLVGSGVQPVAQMYSSSSVTLPVAPSVDTILGSLGTGAVTTTESMPGMYDLKSAILLPPGAYAVLWSSTALPASGYLGSIDWEETSI